MASLGHIAVGMAAARVYPTRPVPRRSWILAAVLWSLLSLAPDADVIGFSFGVAYEDEWGHRGATHSFAFSLALGVTIGVVARLFGLLAIRTATAATLVLATHPLLDTLTDGGLGCALLWPFDLTRYFAPWTPIPVAPIGLDFLSPAGLLVASVELILFLPLFWFGLARRLPLFVLWLVLVWLTGSADPIRERLVGFVLRDDTELASGFSDAALRTVRPGQRDSEVRQRLGPPLQEFLSYWPVREGCFAVALEKDSVASARNAEDCRTLGIERGTSRSDVNRVMGSPEQACWAYSRSRAGGYFRARVVCFADTKVLHVVRRWHKE